MLLASADNDGIFEGYANANRHILEGAWSMIEKA